jgi:hypothetical protein
MLFMVIERFAADDIQLLQQWVLHWRGTGATFEIVPVVEGAKVRALIAPRLDAEARS